MSGVRCAVLAATMIGALGCGSGGVASVTPPDSGSFVVSGNPESVSGATWTFRGTDSGVTYDLAGVLLKPPGPGPFPAVILSHGHDGNAAFYASLLAPTMVSWGLVCIATNYTHATGVAVGAPGDSTQPGASQANVLRAHETYKLLARLGYVDMSRIALHGHSMGAFVTVAVAGAYPSDFRVASHTGGGVRPSQVLSGPGSTLAQASTIRTPYQTHHGGADSTVPLSFDERLDSLFTAMGLEHQFYVYPGETHEQSRTDTTMLARVHAWYTAHGMF
jgi:dienelactone hydrolase